jgi:hypothetical protein
MKTVCILTAAALFALFISGCGLLPPTVYDGSEKYGEAHPDQVQPPSYMDPDNEYNNDSKQ